MGIMGVASHLLYIFFVLISGVRFPGINSTKLRLLLPPPGEHLLILLCSFRVYVPINIVCNMNNVSTRKKWEKNDFKVFTTLCAVSAFYISFSGFISMHLSTGR